MFSQKEKKDWCDSGIKGTDWCAAEESKDLNEKLKHQKGLMFSQRAKKGWCDKGIRSEGWCDEEVKGGLNTKTADDKSLYEGPTLAPWQIAQSLSQKEKRDWCDSGIKGTDWCAQEESKDLNEKLKHQKGLMFSQRAKKGWCDKGIRSEGWCDEEVKGGLNTKTADDKSLYEGPTLAPW
jgi:hypothetical protein